jgi:recombination protein RecA
MIKKKTEDEVSASVVAPKVKERKPDTAADIERKKRAEAITATIFKLTAQKPLGVSYDPWPTVPTGAMIIDNMIGGTPLENGSGQICPGYPRGRIVEIFGGESSGKCLVEDTYLSTGLGLLTLGEIIREQGYSPTCTSKVVSGVSVPVVNRHGEYERATSITWNNRKPVFAVVAKDGTTIESTANHPHLILENGFHVWRNTQDLKPGDYLVTLPSAPCFGSVSVLEDEAYFLGILVADGCLGEARISVTNDDPEVLRVLRSVGPSVLTVEPCEYTANNSVDLHFNCKEGVEAFYSVWGLTSCLAAGKNFPISMRKFDQDSMGNLLAGYLDCEASFHEGTFEVTSASHELLRQVQLMLRGFGVYSTVHPKVAIDYPDTPYWRLFVTGGDLNQLRLNVPLRRDFGFTEPLTNTRISRSVPGVQPMIRALYSGAPITTRADSTLAKDLISGASESAEAVRRVASSPTYQGVPFLPQHLLMLTNYEYVEVVSVTPCGSKPTFDLVVPGTHSFVAEGRVTHNTTLALAAISKVQKAGGIAMFLDYENALSHVYAKAIGVDFDPSRLIYLAPQDLEQGMRMAQIAIKGGCDLIVVDSVAAMVPNVEMAKTADEGPQIGIQARVFSNILPKMVQWLKGSSTVIILLNQTRATISKGGPATPEENTSGGKAIKFYASVRLKLTRTKSEILEKKDPVTLEKKKFPYGNVTQVKMVKNKMDGTQGRTGSIFIRFGFGVDEYLSTIEGACPRKIITRKSASSYVYKDLQFRGRDKLRRYFIENPKEFAEVQKKVTEALLSETLITSVDDAEEDDTILQVDIPSSDLASGGDETEAYGINTDED